MEKVSGIMVGLNSERIFQELTQSEYQKIAGERSFRPVTDHTMPNVSEKVVGIIFSNTDYFNHVVLCNIDKKRIE